MAGVEGTPEPPAKRPVTWRSTGVSDAVILAAAKRLGCHTVYSEDLNHGQDYDGVRVVNPFLAAAAAPPA